MRSMRTLQRLTDAAKAAAEVIGYDRFTTGDVAERAGVSIGTVYRYFPDRVALLDVIDPERYVFTEVREHRRTEVVGSTLVDLHVAVDDADDVRPFDREALIHLIAVAQSRVAELDRQREASARPLPDA
jgi:AcrR family transcriptional regulator